MTFDASLFMYYDFVKFSYKLVSGYVNVTDIKRLPLFIKYPHVIDNLINIFIENYSKLMLLDCSLFVNCSFLYPKNIKCEKVELDLCNS